MIEIAISLAIIAFAMIAVIGILPLGMNVQRQNREETIINQDATVLVNAIVNGEQGLDDLTNYVVAITNTQTWYTEPSQNQFVPKFTHVNFYTYTNSYVNDLPGGLPLRNGAIIVGLLSTPKYAISRYIDSGFFSNHVVATVRSMSGSVSDKAPQTNATVQSMAFAYRVICEVVPYGSGNPASPLLNSSAWSPDWTNALLFNDAWHTNFYHYALNLQADFNEVRLLFRWPVYPNGTVGNGRQLIRTITAGPLQPRYLPDSLTPVPGATLYFVQPSIFTGTQ
jgi:hypothetical protein